jgi:hypothetical protein
MFLTMAENRTLSAPRIHGELKMLGFDISDATVLRWMRTASRNPEPCKAAGGVPACGEERERLTEIGGEAKTSGDYG